MDRRNWLWKKKSSDKVAAAPDLCCDSSYDENISMKAAPDIFTIPEGLQLEEIVKLLNEKLASAQAEITEKDAVAKQHMKVAEEAVTGWEASECEASTLKQQLEEALQKKTALEDRTLHLDNALKECVRQLRLVREEQEQKIHETVSRKTREWEKLRSDLESEVVEMRSQLTQSNSQSIAMSKALQERNSTILELNDCKLRAEMESRNAGTRLEAVEKEYSALKYDLQVLQKELQIRNDERDYCQKMVEASNRQQLENVKKTGKLEAECQRLRMLLKKKLPGPGALARMRVEAETCGKELSRRQYCSEPADDSHMDDKENEFLSDRLRGMEEETKMLKEILAKKNEELQDARLMCARTASRLSRVEEQLKSETNPEKLQAKTTSEEPDKLVNFELMNDFIEMERLAADEKEDAEVKLEAALKEKEEQVRHGNEACAELRIKLSLAERKLKACHCKTDNIQDIIFGVNNEKFGQDGKDGESKARLRSAVGRIIHLVESMAQEYSTDSSPEVEQGPDGGVKRLVAVSKNLLQGKVPVLDFIAELSCVLDLVVGLSLHSGSLGRLESPKSCEDSQRSTGASEFVVEIQQLKSEIGALESNLRTATEMLKTTRIQLETVEEERYLLQQQLSIARDEKKATQNELATVTLLKAKLESSVSAADGELCQFRQLTANLRSELQEEQRRHQEVLQKLQAAQQQVPNIALQKEQELVSAGEKLAECQRTIHALGKQLESLGLPSSSSQTPVRHFARASELPNLQEAEAGQQDFRNFCNDYSRDHILHKQETYWSSSAPPPQKNGTDVFYHSGPQIQSVEEVPEIPFEVRTPARYYRKSKAASKMSSHTNAELLSKSLNAADLTTSTHCSEKQHGVAAVLKLFSRAKG